MLEQLKNNFQIKARTGNLIIVHSTVQHDGRIYTTLSVCPWPAIQKTSDSFNRIEKPWHEDYEFREGEGSD